MEIWYKFPRFIFGDFILNLYHVSIILDRFLQSCKIYAIYWKQNMPYVAYGYVFLKTYVNIFTTTATTASDGSKKKLREKKSWISKSGLIFLDVRS